MSGVPAVVGGAVSFATASERFYAVDAGTGEVRWSFKAEGRVTEPSVAEGLVFFGTNRRQVYALDAESGRQVWKLEVEGGASPPSFAAGILYFGGGATSRTGPGTYLYAVEARTGRILWRYETDQPSPGKPGMARWGLTAPVVVDGGMFFTCWTFAYRLR